MDGSLLDDDGDDDAVTGFLAESAGIAALHRVSTGTRLAPATCPRPQGWRIAASSSSGHNSSSTALSACASTGTVPARTVESLLLLAAEHRGPVVRPHPRAPRPLTDAQTLLLLLMSRSLGSRDWLATTDSHAFCLHCRLWTLLCHFCAVHCDLADTGAFISTGW
jgi:hypothetical protein